MIYLISGLLIAGLAAVIIYVARMTFRGSFIDRSGVETSGKIRSITDNKNHCEVGVVFYIGSEKIEASCRLRHAPGEHTSLMVGNVIQLKYDRMHPQSITLVS